MPNSDSSPRFKAIGILEPSAVCLFLAAFIAGWSWWLYRSDYILYYGDAQAHLNISRSIVDSRTPGYDQLGTVWLPMLHLLCLPFVSHPQLWSTGLAGTIPVASCFVGAGALLFLAARRLYGCTIAASVSLTCLVLNPNILYLAAIPMTEIVFLFGLSLLTYAVVAYRDENHVQFLYLGILASAWMSMTRYDGWFLIPFAAVLFGCWSGERRLYKACLFLLLACVAPCYWLGHSWWETGNALDFFNGPYSASAIQQGRSYAGFHNWAKALQYYSAAARLCSGWCLTWIGILALLLSWNRTLLTIFGFLLLPSAFYIWSVHSSGLPIHVPHLWPFSYYNTRYGIVFTFFAAFAAGSLARGPLRNSAWAFVVPLVAILPWLMNPDRQAWICWKESVVNSNARRAWTARAADYLEGHRRSGQTILAPFGDVAGVFCRASIPLAEVLHEGNGPAWSATLLRPDLLHQPSWAIAQKDDRVDAAMRSKRSPYELVKTIDAPENAVLNIYRRKF